MPSRAENILAKATAGLEKKEEADRLEAKRAANVAQRAYNAELKRVAAETKRAADAADAADAAAAAKAEANRLVAAKAEAKRLAAAEKAQAEARKQALITDLSQIIQKFVIPIDKPETDKDLIELKKFIDSHKEHLIYARRYVDRLFEGVENAIREGFTTDVTMWIDALMRKKTIKSESITAVYNFYYMGPHRIKHEYLKYHTYGQRTTHTSTGEGLVFSFSFSKINPLWIIPYIYTGGYNHLSTLFKADSWRGLSHFKPLGFYPFPDATADVFREDIEAYKLPLLTVHTKEILVKFKNYLDKLSEMKKILLKAGAPPKKSWGLWTRFPENAQVIKEQQNAIEESVPRVNNRAVRNTAVVRRISENGQGQEQGQETVPLLEANASEVRKANAALPGTTEGGRTRKYKSRRRRATRKQFY